MAVQVVIYGPRGELVLEMSENKADDLTALLQSLKTVQKEANEMLTKVISNCIDSSGDRDSTCLDYDDEDKEEEDTYNNFKKRKK